MPKVAYVKEDIDCGAFILKQGCVFIVDKEKEYVLHGFEHGRTSMIQRLKTRNAF